MGSNKKKHRNIPDSTSNPSFEISDLDQTESDDDQRAELSKEDQEDHLSLGDLPDSCELAKGRRSKAKSKLKPVPFNIDEEAAQDVEPPFEVSTTLAKNNELLPKQEGVKGVLEEVDSSVRAFDAHAESGSSPTLEDQAAYFAVLSNALSDINVLLRSQYEAVTSGNSNQAISFDGFLAEASKFHSAFRAEDSGPEVEDAHFVVISEALTNLNILMRSQYEQMKLENPTQSISYEEFLADFSNFHALHKTTEWEDEEDGNDEEEEDHHGIDEPSSEDDQIDNEVLFYEEDDGRGLHARLDEKGRPIGSLLPNIVVGKSHCVGPNVNFNSAALVDADHRSLKDNGFAVNNKQTHNVVRSGSQAKPRGLGECEYLEVTNGQEDFNIEELAASIMPPDARGQRGAQVMNLATCDDAESGDKAFVTALSVPQAVMHIASDAELQQPVMGATCESAAPTSGGPRIVSLGCYDSPLKDSQLQPDAACGLDLAPHYMQSNCFSQNASGGATKTLLSAVNNDNRMAWDFCKEGQPFAKCHQGGVESKIAAGGSSFEAVESSFAAAPPTKTTQFLKEDVSLGCAVSDSKQISSPINGGDEVATSYLVAANDQNNGAGPGSFGTNSLVAATSGKGASELNLGNVVADLNKSKVSVEVSDQPHLVTDHLNANRTPSKKLFSDLFIAPADLGLDKSQTSLDHGLFSKEPNEPLGTAPITNSSFAQEELKHNVSVSDFKLNHIVHEMMVNEDNPLIPKVKAPNSLVEEGKAGWENTLVGHFLGKKLPFSLVSSAIHRMWDNKGLVDILASESGVFYFKFSNSIECDAALEGGPWFIIGRPIVLQKWKPCLKVDTRSQNHIPIWVHLVGVPLEFWNPKGLSFIASVLGKPLHVDRMTASCRRISYARVCIEVSAEKDFIPEFDIEVDDEYSGKPMVHRIQVEYQWTPMRCGKCISFGHDCSKVVTPRPPPSRIKEGGMWKVAPNKDTDQKKIEVNVVASRGRLEDCPSSSTVNPQHAEDSIVTTIFPSQLTPVEPGSKREGGQPLPTKNSFHALPSVDELGAAMDHIDADEATTEVDFVEDANGYHVVPDAQILASPSFSRQRKKEAKLRHSGSKPKGRHKH